MRMDDTQDQVTRQAASGMEAYDAFGPSQQSRIQRGSRRMGRGRCQGESPPHRSQRRASARRAESISIEIVGQSVFDILHRIVGRANDAQGVSQPNGMRVGGVRGQDRWMARPGSIPAHFIDRDQDQSIHGHSRRVGDHRSRRIRVQRRGQSAQQFQFRCPESGGPAGLFMASAGCDESIYGPRQS